MIFWYWFVFELLEGFMERGGEYRFFGGFFKEEVCNGCNGYGLLCWWEVG